MTAAPSLTLCIPVYKGGTHWEECWNNVKELTHYFDSVLISFNKSDLQMTDVSLLLKDKPENVKYIIQPEYLEPLAHHCAIIKHLNTDYVFFLCHDDWLLEPGLKEIQTILMNASSDQQIAVFGSHDWSESESSYPGVTRELLAFPSGITVNNFVLMDIDNSFSFSLSGVVCPVTGLKENISMSRLFLKGFRFDNFIVTSPGIKRIFQTQHPSVRIRLHPGQESRQGYLNETKFDYMTYYFIQCLNGPDEEFMYRTANQMIHFAAVRPKKGTITHFFNLIKESRHWNITVSQYLMFSLIFYKCSLQNTGRRIANAIKKIIVMRDRI